MWASVISSLVCFAVATILFTPTFRKCDFYKELSIFFLFEGFWAILNLAATEIWPKYNFMIWVNYIGTIVFGGYLLYKLIYIHNSETGNENLNNSQEGIDNNFSLAQKINGTIDKIEKDIGNQSKDELNTHPDKIKTNSKTINSTTTEKNNANNEEKLKINNEQNSKKEVK